MLLIAAAPTSMPPSPDGAKPQGEARHFGTQEANEQPAPSAQPESRNQPTHPVANTQQTTQEPTATPCNAAGPADSSNWWFSFCLVIFTGGLVAVGAAQVWLLFDTLNATKKSADAAKQNADVNLKAIRPKLVVSRFEFVKPIRGPNPQDPDSPYPVHVKFDLRNAGPALAMIEKAVARVTISAGGQLPPLGDYSECKPLPVFELVIESGQPPQSLQLPYERTFLESADVEGFKRNTAPMIVYGIIEYRGLTPLPEPYKTPFLWILRAESTQDPKATKFRFELGPLRYNHST